MSGPEILGGGGVPQGPRSDLAQHRRARRMMYGLYICICIVHVLLKWDDVVEEEQRREREREEGETVPIHSKSFL